MKAKTKNSKKRLQSVIKRVHRHVKLAIVPHKHNNYHPHMIRSYGLLAVALAAIVLQLTYNGITTNNVLGRQTDITIESLLEQTNQIRIQEQKNPLNIDNKLVKAAYLKAQDMFDKQYWAHDSPDGTSPWRWFGDVNYNYDEAGENLAKNFSSTSAVMTAWMNSPEHKANILKSDYEDVGFAIVSGELDGKPTTLIVALYGLSAESAVSGVQKDVKAAVNVGQPSALVQFAVAFQSVTPAAIVGLALLAVVFVVAIVSHAHRHKLPKSTRRTWHRHHGIYKAAGLMSFGLMIVLMYGGGQI